MKELIEAIERCGFECEAGRLEDCLDWQELKRRVQEKRSNLMDHNPLMAHIAHCSDAACPICQPPVTGEIDQFGELVSATPAFIHPREPWE